MRDTLLELAHASIAYEVGANYDTDLDEMLKKNPWLKEQGASFVTLTKKDGELRGCIGSLVAHRKLYEDLIYNAKSAAMKDPRFMPLSKEEFENINIEVSILSEPQLVEYSSKEDLKSKIIVGKDGIILKYSSYQSTFLPQVWEQLPSFELFFSHLCQKAGLSGDCLDNKPEIYKYQVRKYK
jgi:AmmeMemoRadiSam system protein A